jgi:hypothetical protein
MPFNNKKFVAYGISVNPVSLPALLVLLFKIEIVR